MTDDDDWLPAATRNILSKPPALGYRIFIRLCSEIGADIRAVHRGAQQALGRGSDRTKIPGILEMRWYQSLATGAPDYSIYDTDEYLGDTWEVWLSCSRKYLRAVRKAGIIPPGASILDLGCGFGFTTAALAQMSPGSAVFGTQLETSRQMMTARRIGKANGFQVRGSVDEVPVPVDVVFGSEYFEHFHDPVAHLDEVLDLSPKLLILANTFTRSSVGHFDTTGYLARGEPVPSAMMPGVFDGVLRDQGFVRMETGFWNNSPVVWRR